MKIKELITHLKIKKNLMKSQKKKLVETNPAHVGQVKNISTVVALYKTEKVNNINKTIIPKEKETLFFKI